MMVGGLLLLDAHFLVKIARLDQHGNLIVPATRKILRTSLRSEYQRMDAVVAGGVPGRHCA